MKKLPDNTNKNLVLNGDFQKFYDDWEDLNNPQGFQVKGDSWQGESIYYAALKNEASVFQSMKVAVEPAAGARYHLRFLYQNTYKTAPGKVLIGKKGAGDVEKLSIDLPSTGGSTSAEPMAVDLHELAHHLPLDLALHKGDDLDITLISPKKTSDDSSTADIRLTRIVLHVELVPLQLLGWLYDNQRVDAGQVLHLCLGATQEQRHQLTFEVQPQSEWVDTDALLWAEDNPQEAIITSPDLGVNQSIELPWLLDCPVLEGEAPYLFDLNIYSHYTAEPYPVAVSLGHHRLTLNVLKGAAFWPVLEYGQSMPLQVQVLSHYTGQPVPRAAVIWRLGEEVLHSGTSDGEGKAGFDYTPGVEGLQTIEVSVPSPYYNDPVVRESLEVLVLRDDPLKAVQVRFEHMEAAVWGEKTGYPDRGSTYSLRLIFPVGSPLLGSQIAVGWRGGGHGPEDLDVRSVPGFGELAQVTGDELEWTLVCGDVQDASFGLFLSCPMLQRESRDNAMSLARNNLKIGEVREANKSPAVDERDSVYCMVQVLTLNNEPALNVQVDWVLSHGTFTSYTGVGGWASAFDTPTVAGPYAMVAQIKVREGAPPLTHSFPIVALATSEWKDDIDFVFDQKPVDSQGVGILCWRGATHTFEIVPKHSGSLFIGEMITLNWRQGVEPEIGLVFDPPMGSSVLLTEAGLKWTIISGGDHSGIFELEVESGYLPRKRELTGRLMATNFDDEVTLVFDQMPSPIGHGDLHPCIGATHQVTLLPHAFSPLQGLKVLWSNSPTEPLPENIEITPTIQTPVLITAGGARYTFDCSASSRKTSLKIFYGLLSLYYRTTYQMFELNHNKLKLGAVRQAAIDPVLSNGERAWLQIQYLSWFSNSPVPGMAVQWSDAKPQLARSETDAEGWAGHEYEPQMEGPNSVNAQVLNLYDGSSVGEVFEVFALRDSPWEDLKLQTDDQPLQPWAKSTMFPRRDDEFSFAVSVNENSYLNGQYVALGLAGTGPDGLGLEIEPVSLGHWRPLHDDLPFRLKAGDKKDGSFNFRLAASRLLELSPPNAVSLGAASSAVKLSGGDGLLQVVDWGSLVTVQVRALSTLSGKAIAGMTLHWEGTGMEAVSTKTNFYGVAKTSFTPTHVGSGQVTARVEGDQALESLTFSYTVNEPRKILEMVSDDQSGYSGKQVSAYVIVVSSRTGKALQDVEVEWRFKGVSLQPTVTDVDGKASIQFSLPGGQGYRALIASVAGAEFGRDAARLMFELLPSEITELTVSSPAVILGTTLTAEVRGENVSQGTEVVWSFTGLPDSTSVTDGQGMATQAFIPTQIPDSNFANVTATIHGGTDHASTRSMKVCVSSRPNPVYSNSFVYVNNTQILIPLTFPIRMRQNRDIEIKIQVRDSLVGSDLAIFCVQPDVTFDPPAGEYHKVDEWFTWTMNIQAPVGTDFVAVISARGGNGSTGVFCRVIEQAPNSAPDFIIDPDER